MSTKKHKQVFSFSANLPTDLFLVDSYPGWKLACVIYCMFIGTDLASAVFWNLVRLIVILPPWGWEVMGLVLIRSGAVRTDTCCCRPPAMLPLLVGAIEYSVSGCSCVISFFFKCPCTSTLCWLYKICKARFKKKQQQKTTQIRYTAQWKHQNIQKIIQNTSNPLLCMLGRQQGGCLRDSHNPNWSSDTFLHSNTTDFVLLSEWKLI